MPAKKLIELFKKYIEPIEFLLTFEKTDFTQDDIDETLGHIKKILSLSQEESYTFTGDEKKPYELSGALMFLAYMYAKGIVFPVDFLKEKQFYRSAISVAAYIRSGDIESAIVLIKNSLETFKQEPRVKEFEIRALSKELAIFKAEAIGARVPSIKKFADKKAKEADRLLMHKDDSESVSRGIQLLKKAVALDHAEAAFKLACIYEKGIDLVVEKDPAQFETYLSKAISLNSTEAMNKRALLILGQVERLKLGKSTMPRMREELSKRLDRAPEDSEFNKEVLDKKSRKHLLTGEPVKGVCSYDESGVNELILYAYNLFDKAASLGNIEAMNFSAVIAYNNGDYKKAEKFIKIIQEAGKPFIKEIEESLSKIIRDLDLEQVSRIEKVPEAAPAPFSFEFSGDRDALREKELAMKAKIISDRESSASSTSTYGEEVPILKGLGSS